MKIVTTAGRYMKSCALLLLLITLNLTVFAQANPPCLTNSLNISTGTDNNSLSTIGTSDAHWTISTTSTIYGPLTSAPAFIVNPSVWQTQANSRWISVNQNAANYPGGTVCNSHESITFERTFKICEAGSYDFTMSFLHDNYVGSIILDDPANSQSWLLYAGTAPTQNVPGNYQNPPTAIQPFNVTLQPGTYNITVQLGNIAHPDQNGNPFGLSLTGSISSQQGNTIVDDQNPDCANYECSSCSDECYWKVEGNNINGNKFIFGTHTNHDIRFITYKNSGERDRAVIRNNGYVGINTDPIVPGNNNIQSEATARLHVNCINGNDPLSPEQSIYANYLNKSDIRFQNLESGSGDILAIDGEGYVYNTGIPAGSSSIDWHVVGNTANAADYIGTNNNIPFRFYTNGTERMRINDQGQDFDAGFVGINETAPTARLHVDCGGGNDINNPGIFQNSDVRFENLEVGSGDILAIDPSGYVYNTQIDITTLGGSNNSWELTGNTVSSTDYLGTNNNEYLRFNTWGVERMIVESQGVTATGDDDGYVGVNTPDATARLHVNCDLGNDPHHPDHQLQHSDIRFENLEFGEGNILAIDPDGYVYQTTYPADNFGGGGEGLMRMLEEEKAKNVELEERLEALEVRLNAMETTATPDVNSDGITGNKLYQNTPNPFGSETEIRYEINVMQRSAHIMVYDLNGREIAKYQVDKGEGSIVVSSSKLTPGMYLYSLVIDGRAEQTKRMVFSE